MSLSIILAIISCLLCVVVCIIDHSKTKLALVGVQFLLLVIQIILIIFKYVY